MKPQGRHELKHNINNIDCIELRTKMPVVMKCDAHAIDSNGYRVRSLYFDNYNDKALMEKLFGISTREKFRLRLYNGDTSLIKLEKKSKNNNICYKESEIITKEECDLIIKGQYEFLKNKKEPLFIELYAKIIYQQLRPKTIVDYKREAYLYDCGHVRVTIDSDIRKSDNINNFLVEDPYFEPTPKSYILEVKYDNYLPELISNIVSLGNRNVAAFSKYVAARLV